MWLQACCICYNSLGPCLYYDNLITEREYILDLNGTWTVFQECTTSIIQFNTGCGSNGSWTTDMRCPTIGKKEHQIYSHRLMNFGMSVESSNKFALLVKLL